VTPSRPVVRRHLPRTPLVRSDPLSAELAADVYLKREERVVMEGACGASLAGARAMADEIAGSTVVLQVSGRNVDQAVLRDILGW